MRFAFATTLWYQDGCKPKTAQELASIRFTSLGCCSESLGFPDGFLVCISVEPVESSWHQRQMADRPAFQSSLPGLCLACSGLLRPLCINSRLEALENCSATQNKKYKNRDNGTYTTVSFIVSHLDGFSDVFVPKHSYVWSASPQLVGNLASLGQVQAHSMLLSIFRCVCIILIHFVSRFHSFPLCFHRISAKPFPGLDLVLANGPRLNALSLVGHFPPLFS